MEQLQPKFVMCLFEPGDTVRSQASHRLTSAFAGVRPSAKAIIGCNLGRSSATQPGCASVQEPQPLLYPSPQVFSQGDAADKWYVLLQGTLLVTVRGSDESNERELCRLSSPSRLHLTKLTVTDQP